MMSSPPTNVATPAGEPPRTAVERTPGQPSVNEARPIIHVGLHKTATNWFQSFVYPLSESHRFIDRRRVRETVLGTPAFSFDPAIARRALELDAGYTPFAICEEDLSGVLHDGGLASRLVAAMAAERLHALAPEGQIVIVVRAQPALAASCYQQYVREGGTTSPLRYLFPEEHRHLGNVRPIKMPRFDFSQFDHHMLVARYDELFGRENVHVFAYEAVMKNPAALLEEFRRRFGLTLAEEPPAAKRVNSAYRRGVLPVARLANLFTERMVADKRVILHVPYWYTIRKALLEQVNRTPIFGQPPSAELLFGTNAVRWMEARFAAGNRRLAERMEVDLGAFGYPVREFACPPPKPRVPRWRAWMRN